MSKSMKLFLACIAVLAGYLLALNYRYEPVAGSQTGMGTISVWDRWHNRVCVVSVALGNKPLCTLDEMSGLK